MKTGGNHPTPLGKTSSVGVSPDRVSNSESESTRPESESKSKSSGSSSSPSPAKIRVSPALSLDSAWTHESNSSPLLIIFAEPCTVY